MVEIVCLVLLTVPSTNFNGSHKPLFSSGLICMDGYSALNLMGYSVLLGREGWGTNRKELTLGSIRDAVSEVSQTAYDTPPTFFKETYLFPFPLRGAVL